MVETQQALKRSRRDGKNTQKNCIKKKALNEPDCYNGVVSLPEPDILECEVKWALRSTAVNKDSGYGEIPAELFHLMKSVKDDAIMVKKTKIMASGPITAWQTEEEKVEVETDILFLGSKITGDGDCTQEIK